MENRNLAELKSIPIYQNYLARLKQLNGLAMSGRDASGKPIVTDYGNRYYNDDLFYLNAKTYKLLPENVKTVFIDDLQNKQPQQAQRIQELNLSKMNQGITFVNQLDNFIKKQENFYTNNKNNNFIFNVDGAPEVKAYEDKIKIEEISEENEELKNELEKLMQSSNPLARTSGLNQSTQPSPTPKPPRTTTPPPISNKGQTLPLEQIILNAYNSEVGKIIGNDPDRLEYLQLKTYQALSNLKNTSEERFIKQLNNDRSGNEEALRKINDGADINEKIQFMESNDMHNDVYGDDQFNQFNPLDHSKSTPPSPTFNINGNNQFQRKRFNSIGSSSESDEDSDEGNNVPLSKQNMKRLSDAGQKILNAKNTSGTGTQQKLVDQQSKDQADIMIDQVSANAKNAFEAARNNYFTPAPPAGTPSPKKPTDPKDLYPVFTFSKYEGKVDPLNPNKKPSDINYTFKREGRNELDMNSKDAKGLTDNISKISFEKNNEAFIMTLKFKSAISNDSVVMTSMINELHKIKGLSSHFNNITGVITLTFSSKAMVEELLDKLRNNNKDKDGEFEQKEFKELNGNILQKFQDNKQAINLLEQENKIIDDEAKNKLEKELNLDNAKPTGLLAHILKGVSDSKIKQHMVGLAKQEISANIQKSVVINKNLIKLNLFKNVLLNGSGPEGTNFDSILKEALIEKVAAGIFDKFGEIFGVVGKHGLKMNSETEIKNFVKGELESHNKSSINPMIAYANDKVTIENLRAVKTVILIEIDEQIEKEKEKLGKNLAEQAAIPLQLSDIMKKMQTQARGSHVPGV